MAAGQAVAPAQEEEEEFEVNKIKGHQRKGKGRVLQYFVSWVGYPNDGDDCWISEESAAGAPEAVDAYWATIPVADRWERESVAPPAKKASAKRDAAAAKLDDTPAKSHKKKEPASASATKDKAPPAKKAKEDKKDKAEKPAKKDKAPKADKVKPDKVQQPKKAADKVVVPATDDEAAQSDDESAGEYTAGEQNCKHETEELYLSRPSWEDFVKSISTVDQSASGELRFRVVWAEDDSYSFVASMLARERCPQRVIDFYESHLKFRPHVDGDDEVEEEEEEEEDTKA